MNYALSLWVLCVLQFFAPPTRAKFFGQIPHPRAPIFSNIANFLLFLYIKRQNFRLRPTFLTKSPCLGGMWGKELNGALAVEQVFDLPGWLAIKILSVQLEARI